jgi:hypothetical protein
MSRDDLARRQPVGPGASPSAAGIANSIDWDAVPTIEHSGLTGSALCRAFECGPLRVQLVEYSAGYTSAGWCSRTHAVHCLDGVLLSELSDGTLMLLMPGMSQVTDAIRAHCYSTEVGARVLVVDATATTGRSDLLP